MEQMIPPRRILVLGGTGSIGRATVRELVGRGHDVACLVRSNSDRPDALSGARAVRGDATDDDALAKAFAQGPFDAVVSCMASRSGVPTEAWSVDYRAHSMVLAAAQRTGVRHFVLLSAICVQKPKLAFQHAKLAFEEELVGSGLDYSIVRPTAFFKSLSGQVDRVKAGKAFLLFGNGQQTACKPISDGDLARFIADCLEDPGKRNRILPIGGPGPAMTPRQQGEALFALLGQEPRFRSVPVRMFDVFGGILSAFGTVAPPLRAKAELARIGRYYATESMLLMDPQTGHYDAEATPETGTETLTDHYRRLLAGETSTDLGAHKVF